MKLPIIFFLLFGFSQAQNQYPWLNSFPCNSCYGPSYCFNEQDNLPQKCTECLQTTCENKLQLLSLASEGMECIQRAWNDPVHCKSLCPYWSFYNYWRLSRCRNCLTPCVATVFDTGAGQCAIEEKDDGGHDPCTSETTAPCGTCYRANRCFTDKELTSYSGICKDYLKLKCPDTKNITCMKSAFSDPCSTCPPLTTEIESRFQDCELCVYQCTAKKECIDECRNSLPRTPTKITCPVCRAFCEINPFDPNCKENRCDCNECDSCYEKCKALDGGDFNLFNPCECLNKEEDAPVKTEQRRRVLGGTETCEGDFPWAVHIYHRGLDPLRSAVCGGTLFNNKWVVTAAHCFQTPDASLYSVILGENTLSEITGREIHSDIIRIVRHPRFDIQGYNYDVAVIELKEAVEYTEYIQPLAIVPPGTRTDNTDSPSFAGRLCKTIGWGLTSSKNTIGSNTLMQLGVRITPQVLCEIQTLKGYDQGPVLSPRPGIPPTKFCAGGIDGEDSCNGDSGSSLFCLHADGKHYLHGITSYGTKECGKPLHPGVYTKVAEVSNWINLCISVNKCSA